MSTPNSNSQLKKIQGSAPYTLTSPDGSILGVNGAFVREQFQKIANEGVIPDVVQYLFIVSDKSRKNPRLFVAKNTRMLLLLMLLHHVHALHVIRKSKGVPEFESNLIQKYKWFMNVDLQGDKDAKDAFETFKKDVNADTLNALLDWNTFVRNVKTPVEFSKAIVPKYSEAKPEETPEEIREETPEEIPEETPKATPVQSGGSLTVYWTRHALSCANVLKDLGKKGKRSGLAPNSSIADVGIEQCRQFRDQINQSIGTTLDFVGASALLRSQQTAALLYNPETVHVLPYISEKRSLLPDDDNQPMSETENTAMYQKFKQYMEGKYIFDTEDKKIKSELKYRFKDMFEIQNEKEAFKVKSDPMLILPTIYEMLKKEHPDNQDFTIAIVSHQGWLKDAGITNEKVMNCAVVKQKFTVDGLHNLVKDSSDIVFPKKEQTPSIKLGGLDFTFTPTIQPSLKNVFNPAWIQTLPEEKQIQILKSRCGSWNYIPFGIQRKTPKDKKNDPVEKIKESIEKDINRACAQYFFTNPQDVQFCVDSENKKYDISESEAQNTDFFKKYYPILQKFYIGHKYDYDQAHQYLLFDIIKNYEQSQFILEYIYNTYLFQTYDERKTYYFDKILQVIFPTMDHPEYGKPFRDNFIRYIFGSLFSHWPSKTIVEYMNKTAIQTNPMFMLLVFKVLLEDFSKELPNWKNDDPNFYNVFYDTLGNYLFFRQLSKNTAEERKEFISQGNTGEVQNLNITQTRNAIIEFEKSEENRNSIDVNNPDKYLAQLVKRAFQAMIVEPPEQIIRSALTDKEYNEFQTEYANIYSEPFIWTYVGICEYMQEKYISGIQAKPVQNFFRKTLKKGRNVGSAAANATRKVGLTGKQAVKNIQKGTRKTGELVKKGTQKVGSFLAKGTRKVGKSVSSGISKYTAPKINTSGNFFNLGSKEPENAENINEIIPGVTRKNFSNKNKAKDIMKARIANLKTRRNQKNKNVDRLRELKKNPITGLTNDEQAEAATITDRLLQYKKNTENLRKLGEESNAIHGTNFSKNTK